MKRAITFFVALLLTFVVANGTEYYGEFEF